MATSQQLAEKLEKYIPKGDWHYSEFAADLAACVKFLKNLPLLQQQPDFYSWKFSDGTIATHKYKTLKEIVDHAQMFPLLDRQIMAFYAIPLTTQEIQQAEAEVTNEL